MITRMDIPYKMIEDHYETNEMIEHFKGPSKKRQIT